MAGGVVEIGRGAVSGKGGETERITMSRPNRPRTLRRDNAKAASDPSARQSSVVTLATISELRR